MKNLCNSLKTYAMLQIFVVVAYTTSIRALKMTNGDVCLGNEQVHICMSCERKYIECLNTYCVALLWF